MQPPCPVEACTVRPPCPRAVQPPFSPPRTVCTGCEFACTHPCPPTPATPPHSSPPNTFTPTTKTTHHYRHRSRGLSEPLRSAPLFVQLPLCNPCTRSAGIFDAAENELTMKVTGGDFDLVLNTRVRGTAEPGNGSRRSSSKLDLTPSWTGFSSNYLICI